MGADRGSVKRSESTERSSCEHGIDHDVSVRAPIPVEARCRLGFSAWRISSVGLGGQMAVTLCCWNQVDETHLSEDSVRSALANAGAGRLVLSPE